MKLKPVVFLGIAGGVVAAVRKRSGKAAEIASRAYDAAPEPVKQAAGQAAEKASDLAERAKEAAPEPVKQAVDKATGGNGATGGDDDATRRYAAPAEAGSQPPAEAGGAPSDDPHATVVRSVPSDPTDLATPPANLPDDVVVPDTSTDDPSVQEAEAAAAADAGSIGGDTDAPRQT
jgi:hypothetical protein